MDDSAAADQIRVLEERLLTPEVRASADALRQLLSEGFLEFGGSGRTYDKAQVVAALPHEQEARFAMEGFQARLLSPGVVLATYRAVRCAPGGRPVSSLRSSIWRWEDGRWQLVFHQGTPAASE